VYCLSYVLLNAGVDWWPDQPSSPAAGEVPATAAGASSATNTTTNQASSGNTTSSSNGGQAHQAAQPWEAPWDCFASPMPPRLQQLLGRPVQAVPHMLGTNTSSSGTTTTTTTTTTSSSSRRVALPPGALWREGPQLSFLPPDLQQQVLSQEVLSYCSQQLPSELLVSVATAAVGVGLPQLPGLGQQRLQPSAGATSGPVQAWVWAPPAKWMDLATEAAEWVGRMGSQGGAWLWTRGKLRQVEEVVQPVAWPPGVHPPPWPPVAALPPPPQQQQQVLLPAPHSQQPAAAAGTRPGAEQGPAAHLGADLARRLEEVQVGEGTAADAADGSGQCTVQ
jgi:hypothetical protein